MFVDRENTKFEGAFFPLLRFTRASDETVQIKMMFNFESIELIPLDNRVFHHKVQGIHGVVLDTNPCVFPYSTH